MKSLATSLITLLVVTAPCSAQVARHRAHPHGHIVGTHPHPQAPGFPITAAKDSIRINAVGEVISQPVPVIQKERSFDTKAREELSKPMRDSTMKP